MSKINCRQALLFTLACNNDYPEGSHFSAYTLSPPTAERVTKLEELLQEGREGNASSSPFHDLSRLQILGYNPYFSMEPAQPVKAMQESPVSSVRSTHRCVHANAHLLSRVSHGLAGVPNQGWLHGSGPSTSPKSQQDDANAEYQRDNTQPQEIPVWSCEVPSSC